MHRRLRVRTQRVGTDGRLQRQSIASDQHLAVVATVRRIVSDSVTRSAADAAAHLRRHTFGR